MFPEPLWNVILKLLEDVNTPRSLTVKLLIEHGEFGQLANLRTDPRRYWSAWEYFVDQVVTELLRKCRDLNTGIDTVKAAEDAFLAAEKQCLESNTRLDRFLHNGPFEVLGDFQIAEFFDGCKSTVNDILGNPPRDFVGKFGKGATFNDRGQATTIPDKISSQPTVTSLARSFIPFWEETKWSRALRTCHLDRCEPRTIRGNRFTTVPKDATKDRGIAVEPSINIFFQLALGKAIRARLFAIGVDLDDGQRIHQQVAAEASKTGQFATIDLSSASDTICRTLVRLLLPDKWLELLELLRSPRTFFGNRWHHLQKFSSMGNGFTFELETLVFLTLAIESARTQGISLQPGVNVFVYGDDIIVPSECADHLLSVLKFCGLTPNDRKTFVSGNFRESCGGDYFCGVAVRPYYIEEYPHDAASWISLANGLWRLGNLEKGSPYCLEPFLRSRREALRQIPSEIRRCTGPDRLGDIVVHGPPNDQRPKRRGPSDGVFWYRTWSPITRRKSLSGFEPEVVLAAALYGVPSAGAGYREESSVSGYKFKWIPCS